MTIPASDTFIRANQSGWGTASDGESWTFTGASSTNSIASNEGLVKSNGSVDTFIQLGSQTSADQEILCRMAIGDHTGDICGVLARFSSASGTSCYKLLYYSGDIHINKAVTGSGSNLANYGGLTLTNGTFYWFRLRCVGSSIRGKVWQDGTGEPGWMLSVTDSSVASGGFALLANTSSAAGIQFDTFTASTVETNRDIFSRLRLQVLSLRDMISRLNLSVTRLRDISARLLLQVLSRRDIGTRLRLNLVRDIFSRTRVRAQPLRDTGVRLINAALSLRDTATQVRLQALSHKDAPARFKLQVLSLRDTLSRVRLQVVSLRDTISRIHLQVLSLKDIRERLILASLLLKDVPGRTRVASLVARDSETRARIAALLARDVRGKTILGIPLKRDIFSRSILYGQYQRDVLSRFILFNAGVTLSGDISCLLFLKINPSTGIVLYPLPQPVGYRGVGVGPGVGQPADTIGGHRQ